MYTVTHLLAWGIGHGAWGIPWDDTAPHPRGTVAAGSFFSSFDVVLPTTRRGMG